MKRILLFVATNILVVVTINFLVSALGLRPYLSSRGVNYESLLIFCALFGFVGSFISLQMSRFTAKMAMGVQIINPDKPGGDFEGRLVTRVRKLCQMAQLDTLPEIGIYDSPEVNAFATGPSRSRSLLAISTGLLNSMDDRAIDGVLGHEISHIVNGDMVTMTLLQGVVNTFVMFISRIAVMAIDNSMRSRDEEGRRGGGLGFFAHYLLVSALESVLMLLASPLVYWFSRRREYRADAGSAKMMGRDTMIHALQSLQRGAQVRDDRAPAVSAFKINGYGHGLAQALFSTHPPLEKRIEALKNLQ